MEWITSLYKNTREVWENNGKNSSGYAIFYSPVVNNPNLLIVGYNPGGDERSFKDLPEHPPAEHDYIQGNYRMANRMRYIFQSAEILPVLEKSVKTNLFFFRSKDMSGIKGLEAETKSFCLSQTKQVIDKLKPANILIEGFKTFRELLNLLQLKQTREVSFKDRRVMLTSDYNGTKLIAIPHPTGARGLTNDHWKEVGRLINMEMIG
jgi:hypothetical protein